MMSLQDGATTKIGGGLHSVVGHDDKARLVFEGDSDTPSTLLPEEHGEQDSSINSAGKKRIRFTLFVIVCVVLSVLIASTIVIGLCLRYTVSKPSVGPTEKPIVNLEWWKTTIIYQCYPRSFQDSDGDGNGDLNGLRSRIDYFADVGINAVWLNPIFVSPQRDNGYDISNYTDVDPLFGTLDDLKGLLKGLHAKGIHLLLDLVPNHTSDEHPWFKESRSSVNNSKRNWYVWADDRGDGQPPNNWLSVFGGPAWTLDNQTGQYYLHQFSEFQPDLNFSNMEVQSAFVDILEFWLELGVDGFRIDAVKHLLEDPNLHNETVNPYSTCTDCYDSLIHNLTTDYTGLHSIIRQWRKVLDSYSSPSNERFMVGEAYDGIETVMKYYGNGDEFQFPFNFFLLGNSEWTGTRVSRIVSDWLTNMPEGAWPNWVLGNHDNSRIASKAGLHLARALHVLLLTLPGTPTTYYGEEILMTDVEVPADKRQDIYGDRDKERTPMQWNAGMNAGFTNITSPWLPLADNYTTYNVQSEGSDQTSVLNLYKELVKLRSQYCAFQYANYEAVLNTTDILAYRRFYKEQENLTEDFLIVINFSQLSRTVSIGSETSLGHEIVLSSLLNRTGEVDLNSLALQNGEALVIKSRTMNN